jgi:hypothetical protein
MRTSLRTTGLLVTLAALAACNSEQGIAPDSSPVSVAAVQADVQNVSAATAADAVAAIGSGLASAGVSYLVAPSGGMDLAVATSAAINCSFSQGTGFFTCTGQRENGFQVVRKFKIFTGGAAVSTTSGLIDSTMAIWSTAGRDTSTSDNRTRIRIVNRADTNMSVITRANTAPFLPTMFTNNGHGTQQDTVIFSDAKGVKTYVVDNDVHAVNLVRTAPEQQHPFPTSGTITITLAGSMNYAPAEGSGGTAVSKSVSGTAVVTFNGTQTASLAVGGKTCALNLVTRAVSNCQ